MTLLFTATSIVMITIVIIYGTFYRQGQYADAVVLLNKAIADNQHEQGLYINRGGRVIYSIMLSFIA